MEVSKLFIVSSLGHVSFMFPLAAEGDILNLCIHLEENRSHHLAAAETAAAFPKQPLKRGR